jgi:hypothetical protein
MPDDLDIGVVAEVPEDQRLDVDEGPDSDAIEGGDDTDELDEIYANPGEFVDLTEDEQ